MREFSEDELKEIHARALKRYEQAESYWSPIYARMEKHLEFYSGKQWDDRVKTERGQRPCVVLDKTSTFVNKIVNEERKVDPEIKVNANFNGPDNYNIKLAEILQGWTRYVEHSSNAKSVYSNSIETATIVGMGFMRVCNTYTSENSFDQEFKIDKIELPFSVFMDPAFKKNDGSDANWAFVFDRVDRETYESENGSIEGVDFGAFSKLWFPSNDEYTVAEYFEKMTETDYLLELTDGQNVIKIYESVVVDENGEPKPEYAGMSVLRRKKATKHKVYWFKMNGQKITDYTEFPSKYIPVVPTVGVPVYKDKKKEYVGLLHYLQTPQEMYNYYKSCEVELVSLAPKSPIIAAAGQIERYKSMWENANTKNFAYLPYDPVSLDGHPVPPPQRLDNQAQIAHFQAAAQSCFEDMKSGVAIYDAALGASEKDESGRAILLKTEQSLNGNIHYLYNLKRSIEQIGRVLCDVFQNVVTKFESFRIMNGDSSVQQIMNNPSLFRDEDMEDLAVNITTGPAYASKRTEEADRIIQLLNVLPPNMGASISDLLVKNLDLGDGDEIVKRLRQQMPADTVGQVDPKIQETLNAQTEKINQLNSIISDLNKKLEDKTLENVVKLDIERLKSATTLAEAEIRANTELLIKNPKAIPAQAALNDEIVNGVKSELNQMPILTTEPIATQAPAPMVPPPSVPNVPIQPEMNDGQMQ